MPDGGEEKMGALRPDFNQRIKLDFQGASLSSDTGFLLFRETDERFGKIEGIVDALADKLSPSRTNHSIVQMIRQRVYQIVAGYEDCNDAHFLRVDPALRLALGKDADFGASQSMLSRLDVDFIVTNSRLSSKEVVKTYKGRANVENRIREGKNTLQTSCHKFDANQARLKIGLLAYNLLHLLREFYMEGEEVKRSVEWLIRGVVKVASRVSYHSRYWWVHVASAFPLLRHYQAHG